MMRRASTENIEPSANSEYSVPGGSLGDILSGNAPHYDNHETAVQSEMSEILSMKFEQLALLSGEISEILGRMSGPFRGRLSAMRGVRSSPYEHFSANASGMAAPNGPMASQVSLAEALRMHSPRAGHPMSMLAHDLSVHKNPKTGKVDGRRVASPMLVRWINNTSTKEIEIKGSTWSRENLGMVVSYYNPMIDREIHRNFSSRRYKGRSKCEDAAKEFYDHLKEGYLPDDDEAYMNAQIALAQGGRRDRPKSDGVVKPDAVVSLSASTDASPIMMASKGPESEKWDTVGAAAVAAVASVKQNDPVTPHHVDDHQTHPKHDGNVVSTPRTVSIIEDATDSTQSEHDEEQ